MVFKSWKGLLYHEKLKDMVLEESVSLEILPPLKSGDFQTIKALIREERGEYSARVTYNPDDQNLILKYENETTIIKARLFTDEMKIAGTYTYKDNKQREVLMTLELYPDLAAEK